MTGDQEKNLQLEIQKLRTENELIKQLSTMKGFLKLYFENCKIEKFRIDAFEKTNETYRQLLGKERFPSHESFKMAMNRTYKKS